MIFWMRDQYQAKDEANATRHIFTSFDQFNTILTSYGWVLSRTQPSPEAIRRLAYEISDMKTTNALKVKLLSPKAKLPAKGSNLAAGYDLSSAQ